MVVRFSDHFSSFYLMPYYAIDFVLLRSNDHILLSKWLQLPPRLRKCMTVYYIETLKIEFYSKFKIKI